MPADRRSPAPSGTSRRVRATGATAAALLALLLLLGAPARSAQAPPGPLPGAGTPVPGTPVGVARPGAGTADPAYTLPLPGARVVASFRSPAMRWSAGHRGIDLEAGPGDAVHAPAAGVVTFQGVVVGRSVVVITHGDGLRSSLEPVVGVLPPGSSVARGDVVGTVEDRTGHCPRTCVHWGVRRGQTYLDPLSLLAGAGPVVLLPVPP